jgi:hypothetical protein
MSSNEMELKACWPENVVSARNNQTISADDELVNKDEENHVLGWESGRGVCGMYIEAGHLQDLDPC